MTNNRVSVPTSSPDFSKPTTPADIIKIPIPSPPPLTTFVPLRPQPVPAPVSQPINLVGGSSSRSGGGGGSIRAPTSTPPKAPLSPSQPFVPMGSAMPQPIIQRQQVTGGLFVPRPPVLKPQRRGGDPTPYPTSQGGSTGSFWSPTFPQQEQPRTLPVTSSSSVLGAFLPLTRPDIPRTLPRTPVQTNILTPPGAPIPPRVEMLSSPRLETPQQVQPQNGGVWNAIRNWYMPPRTPTPQNVLDAPERIPANMTRLQANFNPNKTKIVNGVEYRLFTGRDGQPAYVRSDLITIMSNPPLVMPQAGFIGSAFRSTSLQGFKGTGADLINRAMGFRPVEQLLGQTRIPAQATSGISEVVSPALSRSQQFWGGFLSAKTQAPLWGSGLLAPMIGEQSTLLFQDKQLRQDYSRAVRQTFQEARAEASGIGKITTELEGLGRAQQRDRFETQLRNIGQERGLSGVELETYIATGKQAYERGLYGEVYGGVVTSLQAELLGQALFRRSFARTGGAEMPLKQARGMILKTAVPSIGIAGALEAYTGSARQQLSRDRQIDVRELLVEGAVGSVFASIVGTGVAMAGVPTEAGVRRALQTGKKVRTTGAGKVALGSVYVVDPYEPLGDFFGSMIYKKAGVPEPTINIRLPKTYTPSSVLAPTTQTTKTKVSTFEGQVTPTDVNAILGIAPAVRQESPTTIQQTPTQQPTTPSIVNTMVGTPRTSVPPVSPRTTPPTSPPTGTPTTTPVTPPTSPPIGTPTTTPVTTPVPTLVPIPIFTPTPMLRFPFVPPIFPPGDITGRGTRRTKGRTTFFNELQFGARLFQQQTGTYQGLGALGTLPRQQAPKISTKRRKTTKKKSKKDKEEEKRQRRKPNIFLRGLI